MKISFNYEIGFETGEPMLFTETVVLPGAIPTETLSKEMFEQLLSRVHIMLGISYYKLYCPAEIRLQKKISDGEAAFWDSVYRKGLGEFAFRNNLDLRSIHFPGGGEAPQPRSLERKDRALVGIGGGKDSVVAIEWLKEAHYSIDGFVIETYTAHDIAKKVSEVAGISNITIRRMLDQKLFEALPGSFKGHIPISAIYAFLGTLAAFLYDYRCVVVSNEYSSNFGNVEHHGEVINHQWSKSAEFESLFAEYIRTHVTPDIRYFSIVRPFYEIRIAQAFSHYTKYFPHITGCNKKFRIDSESRPRGMWCCECPKCAFIFLILAPFVEREALILMFGRNMLDDKGLLPLFADILGLGNLKPFDCVGTFEEAKAALFMAEAFADTAVAREFLPKIQEGASLREIVMHAQSSPTVPAPFRFCGMKSALIVGYGAEGKATEAYLKQQFPDITIDTADQTSGENYLHTQQAYDIAIKTPGLTKDKITIQYTTATNIFFSEFRGTVIGVTGSKGKSTTASLIHAILCEAGLPAKLAGNIGAPMLDILRESDEKTIAVLELSSYQLDDIEYSPHIAVVTNLFPEHMDYHGDVEHYYDAKKNIIRFQKENDFFVYGDSTPISREWAQETRSQALPYEELPFDGEKIPLLGEHNADNVRAAITVAHILGVPDSTIESAVSKFKGLPHRLELVGEFKGIRFYDDAISTTPESTIAAVKAVPNVQTIFLGGHDRGYDFSELEREVRARGITKIVLFPDTGTRMFADRNDLTILETSSMKEAVAFAYAHTPDGGAALLSCASPSYGLWKNFEEKGDHFKKEVIAASV